MAAKKQNSKVPVKSLKQPAGLSLLGQKAYAAILEIVTRHDLRPDSQICTFYSPGEWKERGEEYCTDAELIVVYDGGMLDRAFKMEHSEYPPYQEMEKALEAVGLYIEEGTHCYAGIYTVAGAKA